jgi:hypothetical protein
VQQVLLQGFPLQYDDELPFSVWVPAAFQKIFYNLAKEQIKMAALQGRIRRHVPIPRLLICWCGKSTVPPVSPAPVVNVGISNKHSRAGFNGVVECGVQAWSCAKMSTDSYKSINQRDRGATRTAGLNLLNPEEEDLLPQSGGGVDGWVILTSKQNRAPL